MHPADRIRGTSSSRLAGKRIVLGVTGSIAAVKTVELARDLIRHGADVVPVMTRSATEIVHPHALEFATGHKPIVTLTGQVEHVELMTKDGGSADLLLIAPCTANTVSKMALGVDDTAVTTFATVALGSGKPILVAPAMHEPMYDHPVVKENMRKLEALGVEFVTPLMDEAKAKLAPIDEIVERCIRALGPRDMRGRKVLVIMGASAEPVDTVRVLTNRSSGKTGSALALAAWRRGAEVECWVAWSHVRPPAFLRARDFESVPELIALAKRTKFDHDLILCCAALGDFAPKPRDGKIGSGKSVTLELAPLPKVLATLRERAPQATLVGFKVEDTEAKAVSEAKKRLASIGLDYCVANTPKAFGSEEWQTVLVRKRGTSKKLHGSKGEVADLLLSEVVA